MKIHIVQKGDTLWEIAKKYNVDFEALKQLNSHLASPDMIMPGMKIRIPAEVKTNKKGGDKTQPKKVVEPKKEVIIKKEPQPKKQEKLEIPDLPKIPIEKSVTLPILAGEEEQYTTTVFPEIHEKKEKPKKQQPKPKPEPAKQPVKGVQQEQPMYTPPAEHAYYPPQSMMPAYYPYCYDYSSMMMPMPSPQNCGCCGQHKQMHGYYPQGAYPQMHGYYPTGTHTQGNQAFNMMNTATPQMYPNQYPSYEQMRIGNDLEMYPRPPIQQQDPKQSTESKKNQETE